MKNTLAGAACLMLLVPLGCGGQAVPTYPVNGRVTFADGRPLRFAFIEFVPQSGGISSRAKVADDGTFVLGTLAKADGCTAGDFKVVVAQHLPANLAEAVGEHASHSVVGAIEPVYSQLATTPLQAKVSATEPNSFDFVVEQLKKPRSR